MFPPGPRRGGDRATNPQGRRARERGQGEQDVQTGEDGVVDRGGVGDQVHGVRVVEVDAASSARRIDEMREWLETVRYAPVVSRFRVTIMDEAHQIQEGAASALLKTLEEPTPGNLIILVSARPRSLPLTILSRCQRVNFQPLPADTVARWLVETGGKNTQRAYLLASLSGGSISQALELDAQDLMAFRAELGRLLSASHTGEPMSLLALSAFLGENKKEIRQGLKILRDLIEWEEVQVEGCFYAQHINLGGIEDARKQGHPGWVPLPVF